jgi:hypothetical protein
VTDVRLLPGARLLAPFSGGPRFVPRYRPPAPPPLLPSRQHRHDREHHCEGDEDGERGIEVHCWKDNSDDKAQHHDTDYSTRLDHPGQYDPLEGRSCGASCVEDDRDRAIVDELLGHPFAEDPARNSHAQRLELFAERLVERLRDLGWRSVREARAIALAGVRRQPEVATR